MINRIRLFITRFSAGRKYGYVFLGMKRLVAPKHIVYDKKTFKLSLPATQAGVLSDFVNLFLDDDYGLKSLDDIPKKIVDIGANIGYFSMFAKLKYPYSSVVAIEPNPDAICHLKRNVGDLGVEIYEFALGDKKGFTSMESAKGDITLSKVVSCNEGSIVVESAIDIFHKLGQIDLLKMDCEGCEWELFTIPNVFDNVNRIRMEYHLIDGRTLDEFLYLVDLIGFRVEKLVKNSGFGMLWLRKIQEVEE